jgi:hypothetical protein
MEFLPPPAPLQLSGGNLAENWKRFRQKFDVYMAATGGDQKEDRVKTSILLHVIGEEAVEVYNTFTWDVLDNANPPVLIPDQEHKLAIVLRKFEEYCLPKQNLVFEMHRLVTCKQQPGMTIDQYVTLLKTRAKTCELGELHNRMVMTQLVTGILDNSVREKLLRMPDLSLTRAVDICKAAETVKIQANELKVEPVVANAGEVMSIKETRARPSNYNKSSPRSQQKSTVPNGSKPSSCRQCGYTHTGKGSCPAIGKTCARCQGRNHFAKVCRTREVNFVDSSVDTPENADNLDQSDEHFIIDSILVNNVSAVNSQDWIELLHVNGSILPVKLDTGAQTNLLSEKDLQRLQMRPKIHAANTKLEGYYGSAIPVVGKCLTRVQLRGKSYSVQFIVVAGEAPALLGRNACEKLGLVKRIRVVDKPICNILDQYPDLFDGLGCLPGEVNISLRPDAEPVVDTCRNIPFKMEEPLKEELKRMQDAGIIEPINEPTEWVHAMHAVYKPNGQLRVCLDPRYLNGAIRREHFKMPTREQITAKFAGCKFFSKFDATKGFWQLKLTEESSRLCTFITPFGRFRYLRLPFGISCAPEIYHRTVYNMFSHIAGVETSMDDICIGGKTREEHDHRVKQVLDICRQQGLKLNREKCQVGVQEMVFLGDVISDKGLRPDPCKVRAVKEFPTPTRQEDLQRFLGMVKYLGRFLEDLSKQTYNLRSLLKKGVRWVWLDVHQREMDNLKNLICSKPILQFYNPDLPIRITTDASIKGLGAVLQQKHGEDWKPVAYASRSITDAESRYATIEKETLAIEFACTRFHQYIFGQKVEIETDHKPLVAIFSKSLNDCPARIQRMRLKLQKYHLELMYTPGVKLVAADTLSRGPLAEYGSEGEKGQPVDIQDVHVVVQALSLAPVWSPLDENREEEIEAHHNGLLSKMPITDRKRLLMKQETAKDPVLQQLEVLISQGWPMEKGDCPRDLLPYWNYRDEMVIADGLILKGMRIVVPTSLREEMLAKIHTGHLGMEKCKRRARAVMFWPKMNSEIDHLVRNCSVCLRYKPAQQPEPLHPHPIPTRPFEKTGADLCAINNKH